MSAGPASGNSSLSASVRKASNRTAALDTETSTHNASGSQRPPYHYDEHHGSATEQESASQSSALTSRYRYYCRLDPRGTLTMPSHILPSTFYNISPFGQADEKQSSMVTIFSIWNSMIGASLLALPWAIDQAGIVMALFLLLFMASVGFYTAYIVVMSPTYINFDGPVEFTDVCRYYFGRRIEIVAVIFSFISIIGGLLVYYVLMCNFVWYTGTVIHTSLHENQTSEWIDIKNDSLSCDVACRNDSASLEETVTRHVAQRFEVEWFDVDSINTSTMIPARNTTKDPFERVWNMQKTVPFFLALVIFPLINIKSGTFFSKFNGLGTVSMIYLMIFVTIKVAECGFHIDFKSHNADYTIPFRYTFPVLSGTLGLSYFCHNFILSLLRNNREPKNNPRDLGIAFALVFSSYIIIGLGFYVGFPTTKTCIHDNFLNSFAPSDLESSIARVLIFFQLCAVYPLVTYVLRVQFFTFLVGNAYPNWYYVMGLNFVVLVLSVLIAVFYPSIGQIIRFVGSASALAFMFALPAMVDWKRRQTDGTLRLRHKLVNIFLGVFGVANFVAQFAMIGQTHTS